MAVSHITEAELARDLHAVLEKVRHGAEVVIEENAQPVAVIRSSRSQERTVDECIALAKGRGSQATMDDEFAHDVAEAIKIHGQPWNPLSRRC